jgi:hypothetical protein
MLQSKAASDSAARQSHGSNTEETRIKDEIRSATTKKNHETREKAPPPPGSSRWSDDSALHQLGKQRAAPTEFISVERMILHCDRGLVINHGLHRDELGGGRPNSALLD